MARLHYGCEPGPRQAESRSIRVALPQLGGATITEDWYSPLPLQRGGEHDIAYCHNGTVLFGHLVLEETASTDLGTAAYEAYRRIFALLAPLGYEHILRIWNYFPDINRSQQSQERYQRFCAGRHRALQLAGQGRSFRPAATAIGTYQPGLQIYFLASRAAGLPVENPRQVSAYCYPKRYSPKSPVFSRAMLKDWGALRHLYLSGTASIVGHQTRHAERTLPQLNETLNNLKSLTANASQLYGLKIRSLSELALLKVYLRYREDYARVSQRLREVVGPEVPLLILQGELCRAELLLEIEGVARLVN